MNCSHIVFDPYPSHILWRVKTHFTQCQVKIKTHQKQSISGLPGLGRELWFSVAGWYSTSLSTKQTLGWWNLRTIFFAPTGTWRALMGLNINDKQKNMIHLCLIYVPPDIGQWLCVACKGPILPGNAEDPCRNLFPLASSHFTHSLLSVSSCVCVRVHTCVPSTLI